jgi:CDP-paratose 2-epimerase
MTGMPVALVTGGAGFIGTNLAHQLSLTGREVIVFDNLSRKGVHDNLAWLTSQRPGRVSAVIGDVRDARTLRSAVERADEVYHLAAQVAVTTSLEDPREDFEVNAGGTLNLLEALRGRSDPPPLIYTSTNKVYGALPDLTLAKNESRYVPMDPAVRSLGISEHRPLDFHSPYGCSKGCADQYVLDHARTYGIRAAVFRMSCIYGPHQHGNEDQGWVAHFLLRALESSPLTVFGDGLQVRDVLYVDDLVAALTLAMQNIDTLSGQAFNIGGGAANTLSLVELIAYLAQHGESAPVVRHGAERTGDQKYYVSDTTKFCSATGWHPQVDVADGLARLNAWLVDAGRVAQRAPTTIAEGAAAAARAAIGAAR